MKPATHILGIDIAKDKFDVNLRLLAESPGRQAATFTNQPKGFAALLRWLRQHGPGAGEHLHACLESTSRYGDALAAFLYQHGCQVSLVNPRRTRAYAESQLTRCVNDAIDARLIADFCAAERNRLSLWEPLSADHQQLRQLTRARHVLVRERQRFANLLETAAGLARKTFQQQYRALERQIQQLDQLLQRWVQKELQPELREQIQLAQTVTGVGFTTALTVLAELPPLHKLRQADQAVALFGLDPIKKTSGTSVDTPARLSRMGSRYGRSALYMPALCALRCNPIIRPLGRRLADQGRSGKYIVVAAMRKLLRLLFGVLKQAQPFDPNWLNPSAPQPKNQKTTPAPAGGTPETLPPSGSSAPPSLPLTPLPKAAAGRAGLPARRPAASTAKKSLEP
jgi:transposase